MQWTLAVAVGVGVVTGLAVAAFDRGVEPLIRQVLDAPLAVLAMVPAIGLLVVALVNWRWLGGDTTTTDAYVRAYHERAGTMGLGAMVRKIGLAVATLGSGSALGFEGPAILLGGTVGSVAQRRLLGRIRPDDAKVLMVAGAAAGVAAIFKAPLTGVCFALEVPYRADLARRALPAALAAAGSAYVTFVLIVGTAPLLETGGSAPIELRDIGGGLLLGFACGALARLGALMISGAKRVPLHPLWRAAGAACALVIAAFVAEAVFDAPLHLGPGYHAIEWATDAERSVGILAGLFAIRALTTLVCVAGGGVGGLFIPLVTQGAIVGALVQSVWPTSNAALYPTVGIAALLGAGYRTPLAGVAFVAEATGQPGFLVPALLAAAAAQLVMGRDSFSPYQLGERRADVEPLTRLPVRDLMTPNANTVSIDWTLARALDVMLRDNRRWAPVLDASGDYSGLLAVTDIAAVEPRGRDEITVAEIMRTDIPAVDPDESVFNLAQRTRTAGIDASAVVEHGRVVGVITRRDLSNVQVLLDRLTDGTATP